MGKALGTIASFMVSPLGTLIGGDMFGKPKQAKAEAKEPVMPVADDAKVRAHAKQEILRRRAAGGGRASTILSGDTLGG